MLDGDVTYSDLGEAFFDIAELLMANSFLPCEGSNTFASFLWQDAS